MIPIRYLILGCFVSLWSNFSTSKQLVGADDFRWDRLEGGIAIRYGDTKVCEFYHQHPKIPRPFFAQVQSQNGVQITRPFPPVAGKDAVDHELLHPGVWLAFADLNGVDFWRNKGRIQHIRYTTEPRLSDHGLDFSVEERLLDEDQNEVCRSASHYRCLRGQDLKLPSTGWLLMWHTQMRHEEKPLVFGGQHEMGLGFRVATPITVKGGKGTITGSHGGLNEKGNWGRPAQWWDYSANVDEQRSGILAVNGTPNSRPVWSHARDYGFIAMNPSGTPAKQDAQGEAFTVPPGETLHFCYAFYFYSHPSEQKLGLADSANTIHSALKTWVNANK